MRMQGVLASGPGAPGEGYEPDVLAPAEYEDLRNRAALDRERLLMYAVLEDALSCYRQYAKSRLPRTRQLHQEAREWVASDDRSSLFAFASICETLDIDPDMIRCRLQAWESRNGLPGPIGAPPRGPRRR
jgi:hypothetical protein